MRRVDSVLLGLIDRVFNLILLVLYTGMQWKCMPVPRAADGTALIHYTTIYKVFANSPAETKTVTEKALAQTTVDDPLRWPEWEQVAEFAGLVRRDDNGYYSPVQIEIVNIFNQRNTVR